ncbi:HPF/RaiA family ribosome-associated protein [Amycolatopsis plumensis]|uniref:HPF/RaiA family ribosome-associated protein n=1 Tax=Amycolatopsis plumensis TaxID=236508 RepID=A0ABV5UEJ9_9PSEU
MDWFDFAASVVLTGIIAVSLRRVLVQIQVNTDHNIHGGEGLAGYVTTDLEQSLSRFRGWLTRVEVHLSEDGGSKPEDKKCVIEARPGGKQPVAVTHHAASVDDAYAGAAHKLGRVLDSRYGRAHDHKGSDSIRHMPAPEDPDVVGVLEESRDTTPDMG